MPTSPTISLSCNNSMSRTHTHGHEARPQTVCCSLLRPTSCFPTSFDAAVHVDVTPLHKPRRAAPLNSSTLTAPVNVPARHADDDSRTADVTSSTHRERHSAQHKQASHAPAREVTWASVAAARAATSVSTPNRSSAYGDETRATSDVSSAVSSRSALPNRPTVSAQCARKCSKITPASRSRTLPPDSILQNETTTGNPPARTMSACRGKHAAATRHTDPLLHADDTAHREHP